MSDENDSSKKEAVLQNLAKLQGDQEKEVQIFVEVEEGRYQNFRRQPVDTETMETRENDVIKVIVQDFEQAARLNKLLS